jgi:hypothetical protein
VPERGQELLGHYAGERRHDDAIWGGGVDNFADGHPQPVPSTNFGPRSHHSDFKARRKHSRPLRECVGHSQGIEHRRKTGVEYPLKREYGNSHGPIGTKNVNRATICGIRPFVKRAT